MQGLLYYHITSLHNVIKTPYNHDDELVYNNYNIKDEKIKLFLKCGVNLKDAHLANLWNQVSKWKICEKNKILDYIYKLNIGINTMKELAQHILSLQDKEILKIIFKQDALLLRYIKNQNEYICKIAVKQNGFSMKYVNPILKTKELYKLMIKQIGQAETIEEHKWNNLVYTYAPYDSSSQYYKQVTKKQTDNKYLHKSDCIAYM